MSNLCSIDLKLYNPTGNTPSNKPISKKVVLVRSQSSSVLKERYKQSQACEDKPRASSSPRKRKTSNETPSSGRSSTESIASESASAPIVPAKKTKESEPLKASNNFIVKKEGRSKSPNNKELVKSKANRPKENKPV